MGVSIYPAQGGDGFKLRKIITTTGLVDLGQARDAYIVIAGGGGGGAGCSTSTSWSGAGGGGGGALGGSMLIKEFHATIGAGGTAGALNAAGGNGGHTYLSMYGSQYSLQHNGIAGQYILATGGQGGLQVTADTPYADSFENIGAPTISGWSTFRKLHGSSGAGGGYRGNANPVTNNPMFNYSNDMPSADAYTLNSWTPNQVYYYQGQSGAGALVSQSNFGGFNSIMQRPAEPLMNNTSQNTANLPLFAWSRNTTTATYRFIYSGAQAMNGNAGGAGGSGYWTGGGGSGDSQGGSQRGTQGGSSRAFRGGLGGAAGSGANGGAGGGAGIVANGGNGGDASGSTSGISGVGGLGGGGGAGGNLSGTQRAGGAGGQGAIAIYW